MQLAKPWSRDAAPARKAYNPAMERSDLTGGCRDLPEVPEEELALIDERIREFEANPDDVVPWDEVRAELWPRG